MARHPSIWQFALCLLASAFAACTPSLVGTPDQTAIVVVDGINTMHSTALGMKSEQGLADVTRLGESGVIRCYSYGFRYCVCSGLLPGKYRLAAFRFLAPGATVVSYTFPDPGPDVQLDPIGPPDLDITPNRSFGLAAGQVAYLGQIKIEHLQRGLLQAALDSYELGIAVEYRKEVEIAAWRKMLDTYGESPWGGPMKVRLRKLEAKPD